MDSDDLLGEGEEWGTAWQHGWGRVFARLWNRVEMVGRGGGKSWFWARVVRYVLANDVGACLAAERACTEALSAALADLQVNRVSALGVREGLVSGDGVVRLTVDDVAVLCVRAIGS